jgi:hypothetical protein
MVGVGLGNHAVGRFPCIRIAGVAVLLDCLSVVCCCTGERDWREKENLAVFPHPIHHRAISASSFSLSSPFVQPFHASRRFVGYNPISFSSLSLCVCAYISDETREKKRNSGHGQQSDCHRAVTWHPTVLPPLLFRPFSSPLSVSLSIYFSFHHPTESISPCSSRKNYKRCNNWVVFTQIKTSQPWLSLSLSRSPAENKIINHLRLWLIGRRRCRSQPFSLFSIRCKMATIHIHRGESKNIKEEKKGKSYIVGSLSL